MIQTGLYDPRGQRILRESIFIILVDEVVSRIGNIPIGYIA
jgi:hypothetical protein